ncbi:hypothetical protein PF004_g23970 [Phytophthora fragariae]|uniref:Uncharacterized protein n=2 Tax=Phytophthora fragariae TaxID=53985 RepID=A0A6G0MVJ1_9STRA|nr:hypothetical protein PF004_g23970 [Phytophthora fragariae]
MAGVNGPPPEGRPPRPPDPSGDGEPPSVELGRVSAQGERDQDLPPPPAWSTSGVSTLRSRLAESSGDVAPKEGLERLHANSTAVYPLHADTALRNMTEDETEAMEAYLSRTLELPAPPTFLSCTATAFKRAAMVAFHREHVEATLIADVPANARLGRHIARQSILRELVSGNASNEAGRNRMQQFIKGAQRITFDGEHTLSVIFMYHRAVAPWDGEEFRLRGQRLRLQSIGAQVPGVSSPALLARNYAIRILGTENLHAVQLVQLLEDIARVSVLDVRLPGLPGRSHPDNDYWTVIFDARSCPLELSGVSAIGVGDENLTLHHFQRHQQPLCWRCLNPHHMQSRCKVTETRLPGPMYAGQAAQWTFRAEIFIGRPSA